MIAPMSMIANGAPYPNVAIPMIKPIPFAKIAPMKLPIAPAKAAGEKNRFVLCVHVQKK